MDPLTIKELNARQVEIAEMMQQRGRSDSMFMIAMVSVGIHNLIRAFDWSEDEAQNLVNLIFKHIKNTQGSDREHIVSLRRN